MAIAMPATAYSDNREAAAGVDIAGGNALLSFAPAADAEITLESALVNKLDVVVVVVIVVIIAVNTFNLVVVVVTVVVSADLVVAFFAPVAGAIVVVVAVFVNGIIVVVAAAVTAAADVVGVVDGVFLVTVVPLLDCTVVLLGHARDFGWPSA
jgi:hypothetical protein